MNLRRVGKAANDRMIEACGIGTKQALCEKLGISSRMLASRYLRDILPANYIIQCAQDTCASLASLTSDNENKLPYLSPKNTTIPSTPNGERLISASVKTIENEQLIPSKLILDRCIIPEAAKNLGIIIDKNVRYLAGEQPLTSANGIRLLKTENSFIINNIIKYSQRSQVLSLDNNQFFELLLNEILLLARFFISLHLLDILINKAFEFIAYSERNKLWTKSQTPY
ncbi:helix-turn-helix domain-containing protein [Enterobacter sp. HK-058-C-ECC]|uniref:helix-turn-helix domain-containing protein n=1 Tax=Enterobacter sp. HK-058-C-ECC TaxID=3397227 RepID=UPI0039E00D8F